MGIYINWRNSSGGNISSTTPVYNTLVNTWELVTTTVKAPANAAIARVAIRGYMDSSSPNPAGYADNGKFSQENTFYLKYCMPDLGQHCANWCWVAAAANSIYWYSQHGYLQLIDDPADPTENDNDYINQVLFHPTQPFPPSPPDNVYRLLQEIATDCLYPGMPEGMITIDNTWNKPINDVQYFFGLQEFINEQFAPQAAPLVVHEIVDNNLLFPVPPIGPNVEYRPPTLEDYKSQLENCQDVLLWLDENARHENTENYPYRYEDTDHVVTGVGFSYDNSWILVSDPWTPGSPDNSNDLTHTLTPYDNLQVLIPNPLWVLYNGMPVQISKIVFVSPVENVPANYSVDAGISSPFQGGLPGMTLSCTVWVTNTGNVQDTYTLTATDDAGWNPTGLPPSITVASGMTWIGSVDVTIPLNTPSGTIDNITFTATGTGVSDSDSCIAQVTTYFIKYCMPDLGQHSKNWCWVAAAANSIYWYSQPHENYPYYYPQLIDAPENAVENDNNYITQMIATPPPPVGDSVYRLLQEIATDCLFPGVPENTITIDNTWDQPINDVQYFFGLQEFIDEQGAPLIVHEIVDNNLVIPAPPPIENKVVYGQPTLEDYQRELGRCQDVLLWLNYRHHEDSQNYEDTDHVVTGVGFSYDNQWLIVSDPWTPGAPDHSNDLTHTLTPYDDLQVISVDPLWVLYNGMPVQVSKMVFVSPEENIPTTPWTGTATFRLENLYKVSLEKDLQINTGSKLIVKFYDYSDTYESENIIENNIALPLSIVDNENVPHPAQGSLPVRTAVKKASLVLTTDDENEVISTIAFFTVHQSDLRSRYLTILRIWSANPTKQPAFRSELIDILKQWSGAPT
jgi:hypothetical protein